MPKFDVKEARGISKDQQTDSDIHWYFDWVCPCFLGALKSVHLVQTSIIFDDVIASFLVRSRVPVLCMRCGQAPLTAQS